MTSPSVEEKCEVIYDSMPELNAIFLVKIALVLCVFAHTTLHARLLD